MMKISRGAWIAIAAVVAVPATVAIAKKYEHSGWQRMSPDTRARLDEGKLAMAKTALKLTPEQDRLWLAVEAEVRNEFKARQDKILERQKMRDERKAERAAAKADNKDAGDRATPSRKRGDLSERFEKMSTELTQRADRLKAFSTAFKPFYASLSDEQKDVLRPLMRDLAPGMGGRGGKRMAHGGGHHGKWYNGWKRDWRDGRGERGAKSEQADSVPEVEAAPAAEPQQ